MCFFLYVNVFFAVKNCKKASSEYGRNNDFQIKYYGRSSREIDGFFLTVFHEFICSCREKAYITCFCVFAVREIF